MVSVERVDRRIAGNTLPRRKVTVELRSVWKGCGEGEPLGEGRRTVVWTGLDDGDCGYDFAAGTSYLIYAFATDDGELNTGICSRTRRLDAAAADLAALGEPLHTFD